MKKYRLTWIQEDGNVVDMGTTTTNNPKDYLFNRLCEMICRASFFYDPNKPDNVRKWIKTIKTDREYYFAECNNNVISLMEII